MPHLIYHSKCYDGWCAAWITTRAFPNDNIELVPWTYGEPYPALPDRAFAFMIDVCFPQQEMEQLRKQCGFLRVLDHHKTAEATLLGFPNARFDNGESGATLAWQEFYPELSPPPLVAYTKDMDIWEKKLPYTEQINAWIRSFPMDLETWDTLDKTLRAGFDRYGSMLYDFAGTPFLATIIDQGAAIIRARQNTIDQICEHAIWMVLEGHIAPFVNCHPDLGGAAAHRLTDLYPCSFGGYYFDRKDGIRQWGLRRPDGSEFDVSAIAKAKGGGGHAGAAGFETPTSYWPTRDFPA